MKMINLLNFILVSFLILLPSFVYSKDALLLAGVETNVSSSKYFYLATAVPLPKSTLAKGFVVKFWMDYQTYSYEAGAIDVDAEVNSVSATIGYHDSGYNYWWNTHIGIIQSDTSLTPENTDNDSAGVGTGAKLQLEGGKQLTADSKISANLTLLSRQSAYWFRTRYLLRNDDDSYHGPEVIVQGDENYEAFQLGWVLTGMSLSDDWDYTLKGGFRLDDGNVSEYIGIEVSAPY